MSFSSKVKEELSKLNNLANKDEVRAEFTGYLMSVNINEDGKKIKFSTENEYNINRFNKLLNNLNIDYDIQISGKVFVIQFSKDYDVCKPKTISENEEKAIVRGVFLGAGSISEPKTSNHLEIILRNETDKNFIVSILEKYEIKCKELKRKKGYSIYLKDGEEISKTLALIGASKSMLKFEEIRVVKDTRNNINRIVNCETANLNKTVNAAIEQIEAIKKLKKNGKFEKIDKNLKEIAILREENPDMTLQELGQKLKEPIGKSGVNHRLKKIIGLAEEIDAKE